MLKELFQWFHRIGERLEFQRDRITICGHQSNYSKRIAYENVSNEQRIIETTDCIFAHIK